MTTTTQARSGLNMENLQEVLDASDSAKQATQGYQQQYETPLLLAEVLNWLLPGIAPVAFDPQCAKGNVFNGVHYDTRQVGFELDNRFRETKDLVQRVIGNCVKAFAVLEDCFPDLRFPCSQANPPFGLYWKMPDGSKAESTEYTWRKLQELAAEDGFGWFLANHKTIEKLGIDRHPRVYLYQVLPVGVWPNCEVSVGVVHWCVQPNRPTWRKLEWDTLDYGLMTSNALLKEIREFWQQNPPQRDWHRDYKIQQEIQGAFEQVQKILDEEKLKQPDFNVWLDHGGKLKTYLSTRAQLKRKLKREDVLRLTKVANCHPLTLTTDRETRKLLHELLECGAYTIQPEAKAAIEHALVEVAKLACPIMPVTDFETVAYADEEDHLECVNSGGLAFTPGKKYEVQTATYGFTEKFKRNKVHFREPDPKDPHDKGETYTKEHECMLSGKDRYIQLTDDNGQPQRFQAKPQENCSWQHPESRLWDIFKRPEVKTLAETAGDIIKQNLVTLETCEVLGDYTYYPGQKDYVARVGVKDYGLIGADTGVGKTLFALSIIQLKGPKRALIIAPQGTMRSSEEDDDDEQPEYNASQWVKELRRFAPGFPVFELFSEEDHQRIRDANKDELPPGVYISYYEAMFTNKAREHCPDSWDDERLIKEIREKYGEEYKLPPTDGKDTKKYWVKLIGQEKDGIRSIVTPCLATRIGHLFDMICVDEAHYTCNLDALRTQMLLRLQPKYRYGFTATPIPNIVSNLFSLMGWLCVPDWYKGNRRSAAWPYAREDLGRFSSTFLSEERDFTQEDMNREADRKAGNWRNNRGKCIKTSPVISSPARLLKILKPSMAYISKNECNPNYTEAKLVDVRVPMGKEQTALYAHFLNRGNIKCNNARIRARKQIAYLRNICADPAGFEHGGPEVKSNFNPKTVAILELTRDLLAKGEQVLIICARVGQTNTIFRKLFEANVKVARIDSTIPPEHHARMANFFKTGRARVMCMGIKCAVGHSFEGCPNAIIGSLEYSYGSLHQARGRVDRVNSKLARTIYCILHQHSIEETMYDLVATKEDAATICLRGKRMPRDFKPVDMNEVLATTITNYKDNGLDESGCEMQWPKLCQSFQS